MSSLREQIEKEKEEFERSAGMQRAVKALPKPEPEKGEQVQVSGDGWQSIARDDYGAIHQDYVPWQNLRPTSKQISYLGSLTKTMRNIAQNKGWLEVVDVIDEVKRPTKRGKASDLIDCFQSLKASWSAMTKEMILEMIEEARQK